MEECVGYLRSLGIGWYADAVLRVYMLLFPTSYTMVVPCATLDFRVCFSRSP